MNKFKNKLERLEKKMNAMVPSGMSKSVLKQYINETSTALEMYLKATTEEEKQEANNLQQAIDEKYNVKNDREPNEKEIVLFEKWLE